jgi:hypothetical protein
VKALSTVQEKIPAIWWGVMVLCGSRAADSDFGTARKGGTARKKQGNEKDSLARKCRQQDKYIPNYI